MWDAVQIQSMFIGNIICPVNHGAPRPIGKNLVKHGFILMDRLGVPIIFTGSATCLPFHDQF
jgi:hypothetical protein